MKVNNYMINLTMSEHIWHQRQNSVIDNYIQIDINVKFTIQVSQKISVLSKKNAKVNK